jgi:hypothetical protein
MVHPAHEVRTPNAELLGTTAGMLLTAVFVVASLAVLIGTVFWADTSFPSRRPNVPHREISPGQGDRPRERVEDRDVPEGGHPHGKLWSWVLVAGVTAAFTAGGIAIIMHAWWLLWACAGLLILAIPVGKVIGIMDNTVSWGSTPAAVHTHPEPPPSRILTAAAGSKRSSDNDLPGPDQR